MPPDLLSGEAARRGTVLPDRPALRCGGARSGQLLEQGVDLGVKGHAFGSLARELAESDPSARTDLAASFDRWEAPIGSGLTRVRERGELSERADVASLATAVLAAIQGGTLLSQVRRSSTAYRHAVSAVLDSIESYVIK